MLGTGTAEDQGNHDGVRPGGVPSCPGSRGADGEHAGGGVLVWKAQCRREESLPEDGQETVLNTG